jgi:hypothetical protein
VRCFVRAVACVALLVAAAGAAQGEVEGDDPPLPESIFRGETIVVTPEDGFDDFEPWRRSIEAAIARAPLKQRSELTAHDREQILVLKDDMPRLKQSLEAMDRVISANRRASMLTDVEKLELARAYLRTQAILQNVPDELMIRCVLRNRPGQRNDDAICEFDYARAQDLLRKVGGSLDAAKFKRVDPKRRFQDRYDPSQ